ncbi:uncharacterized protein LOC106662474 [Cimex lectularius]|uniref:Uncharacterized protein n=1 Tax=Cimex lectularius TaxID=79782 RepID=A0A8I6TDS9_CIMLE|nr:uncharacterized protein LOC106662474 [Cimex lectularius]
MDPQKSNAESLPGSDDDSDSVESYNAANSAIASGIGTEQGYDALVGSTLDSILEHSVYSKIPQFLNGRSNFSFDEKDKTDARDATQKRSERSACSSPKKEVIDSDSLPWIFVEPQETVLNTSDIVQDDISKSDALENEPEEASQEKASSQKDITMKDFYELQGKKLADELIEEEIEVSIIPQKENIIENSSINDKMYNELFVEKPTLTKIQDEKQPGLSMPSLTDSDDEIPVLSPQNIEVISNKESMPILTRNEDDIPRRKESKKSRNAPSEYKMKIDDIVYVPTKAQLKHYDCKKILQDHSIESKNSFINKKERVKEIQSQKEITAQNQNELFNQPTPGDNKVVNIDELAKVVDEILIKQPQISYMLDENVRSEINDFTQEFVLPSSKSSNLNEEKNSEMETVHSKADVKEILIEEMYEVEQDISIEELPYHYNIDKMQSDSTGEERDSTENPVINDIEVPSVDLCNTNTEYENGDLVIEPSLNNEIAIQAEFCKQKIQEVLFNQEDTFTKSSAVKEVEIQESKECKGSSMQDNLNKAAIQEENLSMKKLVYNLCENEHSVSSSYENTENEVKQLNQRQTEISSAEESLMKENIIKDSGIIEIEVEAEEHKDNSAEEILCKSFTETSIVDRFHPEIDTTEVDKVKDVFFEKVNLTEAFYVNEIEIEGENVCKSKEEALITEKENSTETAFDEVEGEELHGNKMDVEVSEKDNSAKVEAEELCKSKMDIDSTEVDASEKESPTEIVVEAEKLYKNKIELNSIEDEVSKKENSTKTSFDDVEGEQLNENKMEVEDSEKENSAKVETEELCKNKMDIISREVVVSEKETSTESAVKAEELYKNKIELNSIDVEVSKEENTTETSFDEVEDKELHENKMEVEVSEKENSAKIEAEELCKNKTDIDSAKVNISQKETSTEIVVEAEELYKNKKELNYIEVEVSKKENSTETSFDDVEGEKFHENKREVDKMEVFEKENSAKVEAEEFCINNADIVSMEVVSEKETSTEIAVEAGELCKNKIELDNKEVEVSKMKNSTEAPFVNKIEEQGEELCENKTEINNMETAVSEKENSIKFSFDVDTEVKVQQLCNDKIDIGTIEFEVSKKKHSTEIEDEKLHKHKMEIDNMEVKISKNENSTEAPFVKETKLEAEEISKTKTTDKVQDHLLHKENPTEALFINETEVETEEIKKNKRSDEQKDLFHNKNSIESTVINKIEVQAELPKAETGFDKEKEAFIDHPFKDNSLEAIVNKISALTVHLCKNYEKVRNEFAEKEYSVDGHVNKTETQTEEVCANKMQKGTYSGIINEIDVQEEEMVDGKEENTFIGGQFNIENSTEATVDIGAQDERMYKTKIEPAKINDALFNKTNNLRIDIKNLSGSSDGKVIVQSDHMYKRSSKKDTSLERNLKFDKETMKVSIIKIEELSREINKNLHGLSKTKDLIIGNKRNESEMRSSERNNVKESKAMDQNILLDVDAHFGNLPCAKAVKDFQDVCLTKVTNKRSIDTALPFQIQKGSDNSTKQEGFLASSEEENCNDKTKNIDSQDIKNKSDSLKQRFLENQKQHFPLFTCKDQHSIVPDNVLKLNFLNTNKENNSVTAKLEYMNKASASSQNLTDPKQIIYGKKGSMTFDLSQSDGFVFCCSLLQQVCDLHNDVLFTNSLNDNEVTPIGENKCTNLIKMLNNIDHSKRNQKAEDDSLTDLSNNLESKLSIQDLLPKDIEIIPVNQFNTQLLNSTSNRPFQVAKHKKDSIPVKESPLQSEVDVIMASLKKKQSLTTTKLKSWVSQNPLTDAKMPNLNKEVGRNKFEEREVSLSKSKLNHREIIDTFNEEEIIPLENCVTILKECNDNCEKQFPDGTGKCVPIAKMHNAIVDKNNKIRTVNNIYSWNRNVIRDSNSEINWWNNHVKLKSNRRKQIPVQDAVSVESFNSIVQEPIEMIPVLYKKVTTKQSARMDLLAKTPDKKVVKKSSPEKSQEDKVRNLEKIAKFIENRQQKYDQNVDYFKPKNNTGPKNKVMHTVEEILSLSPKDIKIKKENPECADKKIEPLNKIQNQEKFISPIKKRFDDLNEMESSFKIETYNTHETEASQESDTKIIGEVVNEIIIKASDMECKEQSIQIKNVTELYQKSNEYNNVGEFETVRIDDPIEAEEVIVVTEEVIVETENKIDESTENAQMMNEQMNYSLSESEEQEKYEVRCDAPVQSDANINRSFNITSYETDLPGKTNQNFPSPIKTQEIDPLNCQKLVLEQHKDYALEKISDDIETNYTKASPGGHYSTQNLLSTNILPEKCFQNLEQNVIQPIVLPSNVVEHDFKHVNGLICPEDNTQLSYVLHKKTKKFLPYPTNPQQTQDINIPTIFTSSVTIDSQLTSSKCRSESNSKGKKSRIMKKKDFSNLRKSPRTGILPVSKEGSVDTLSKNISSSLDNVESEKTDGKVDDGSSSDYENYPLSQRLKEFKENTEKMKQLKVNDTKMPRKISQSKSQKKPVKNCLSKLLKNESKRGRKKFSNAVKKNLIETKDDVEQVPTEKCSSPVKSATKDNSTSREKELQKVIDSLVQSEAFCEIKHRPRANKGFGKSDKNKKSNDPVHLLESKDNCRQNSKPSFVKKIGNLIKMKAKLKVGRAVNSKNNSSLILSDNIVHNALTNETVFNKQEKTSTNKKYNLKKMSSLPASEIAQNALDKPIFSSKKQFARKTSPRTNSTKKPQNKIIPKNEPKKRKGLGKYANPIILKDQELSDDSKSSLVGRPEQKQNTRKGRSEESAQVLPLSPTKKKQYEKATQEITVPILHSPSTKLKKLNENKNLMKKEKETRFEDSFKAVSKEIKNNFSSRKSNAIENKKVKEEIPTIVLSDSSDEEKNCTANEISGNVFSKSPNSGRATRSRHSGSGESPSEKPSVAPVQIQPAIEINENCVTLTPSPIVTKQVNKPIGSQKRKLLKGRRRSDCNKFDAVLDINFPPKEINTDNDPYIFTDSDDLLVNDISSSKGSLMSIRQSNQQTQRNCLRNSKYTFEIVKSVENRVEIINLTPLTLNALKSPENNTSDSNFQTPRSSRVSERKVNLQKVKPNLIARLNMSSIDSDECSAPSMETSLDYHQDKSKLFQQKLDNSNKSEGKTHFPRKNKFDAAIMDSDKNPKPSETAKVKSNYKKIIHDSTEFQTHKNHDDHKTDIEAINKDANLEINKTEKTQLRKSNRGEATIVPKFEIATDGTQANQQGSTLEGFSKDSNRKNRNNHYLRSKTCLNSLEMRNKQVYAKNKLTSSTNVAHNQRSGKIKKLPKKENSFDLKEEKLRKEKSFTTVSNSATEIVSHEAQDSSISTCLQEDNMETQNHRGVYKNNTKKSVLLKKSKNNQNNLLHVKAYHVDRNNMNKLRKNRKLFKYNPDSDKHSPLYSKVNTHSTKEVTVQKTLQNSEEEKSNIEAKISPSSENYAGQSENISAHLEENVNSNLTSKTEEFNVHDCALSLENNCPAPDTDKTISTSTDADVCYDSLFLIAEVSTQLKACLEIAQSNKFDTSNSTIEGSSCQNTSEIDIFRKYSLLTPFGKKLIENTPILNPPEIVQPVESVNSDSNSINSEIVQNSTNYLEIIDQGRDNKQEEIQQITQNIYSEVTNITEGVHSGLDASSSMHVHENIHNPLTDDTSQNIENQNTEIMKITSDEKCETTTLEEENTQIIEHVEVISSEETKSMEVLKNIASFKTTGPETVQNCEHASLKDDEVSAVETLEKSECTPPELTQNIPPSVHIDCPTETNDHFGITSLDFEKEEEIVVLERSEEPDVRTSDVIQHVDVLKNTTDEDTRTTETNLVVSHDDSYCEKMDCVKNSDEMYTEPVGIKHVDHNTLEINSIDSETSDTFKNTPLEVKTDVLDFKNTYSELVKKNDSETIENSEITPEEQHGIAIISEVATSTSIKHENIHSELISFNPEGVPSLLPKETNTCAIQETNTLFEQNNKPLEDIQFDKSTDVPDFEKTNESCQTESAAESYQNETEVVEHTESLPLEISAYDSENIKSTKPIRDPETIHAENNPSDTRNDKTLEQDGNTQLNRMDSEDVKHDKIEEMETTGKFENVQSDLRTVHPVGRTSPEPKPNNMETFVKCDDKSLGLEQKDQDVETTSSYLETIHHEENKPLEEDTNDKETKNSESVSQKKNNPENIENFKMCQSKATDSEENPLKQLDENSAVRQPFDQPTEIATDHEKIPNSLNVNRNDLETTEQDSCPDVEEAVQKPFRVKINYLEHIECNEIFDSELKEELSEGIHQFDAINSSSKKTKVGNVKNFKHFGISNNTKIDDQVRSLINELVNNVIIAENSVQIQIENNKQNFVRDKCNISIDNISQTKAICDRNAGLSLETTQNIKYQGEQIAKTILESVLNKVNEIVNTPNNNSNKKENENNNETYEKQNEIIINKSVAKVNISEIFQNKNVSELKIGQNSEKLEEPNDHPKVSESNKNEKEIISNAVSLPFSENHPAKNPFDEISNVLPKENNCADDHKKSESCSHKNDNLVKSNLSKRQLESGKGLYTKHQKGKRKTNFKTVKKSDILTNKQDSENNSKETEFPMLQESEYKVFNVGNLTTACQQYVSILIQNKKEKHLCDLTESLKKQLNMKPVVLIEKLSNTKPTQNYTSKTNIHKSNADIETYVDNIVSNHDSPDKPEPSESAKMSQNEKSTTEKFKIRRRQQMQHNIQELKSATEVRVKRNERIMRQCNKQNDTAIPDNNLCNPENTTNKFHQHKNKNKNIPNETVTINQNVSNVEELSLSPMLSTNLKYELFKYRNCNVFNRPSSPVKPISMLPVDKYIQLFNEVNFKPNLEKEGLLREQTVPRSETVFNVFKNVQQPKLYEPKKQGYKAHDRSYKRSRSLPRYTSCSCNLSTVWPRGRSFSTGNRNQFSEKSDFDEELFECDDTRTHMSSPYSTFNFQENPNHNIHSLTSFNNIPRKRGRPRKMERKKDQNFYRSTFTRKRSKSAEPAVFIQNSFNKVASSSKYNSHVEELKSHLVQNNISNIDEILNNLQSLISKKNPEPSGKWPGGVLRRAQLNSDNDNNLKDTSNKGKRKRGRPRKAISLSDRNKLQGHKNNNPDIVLQRPRTRSASRSSCREFYPQNPTNCSTLSLPSIDSFSSCSEFDENIDSERQGAIKNSRPRRFVDLNPIHITESVPAFSNDEGHYASSDDSSDSDVTLKNMNKLKQNLFTRGRPREKVFISQQRTSPLSCKKKRIKRSVSRSSWHFLSDESLVESSSESDDQLIDNYREQDLYEYHTELSSEDKFKNYNAYNCRENQIITTDLRKRIDKSVNDNSNCKYMPTSSKFFDNLSYEENPEPSETIVKKRGRPRKLKKRGRPRKHSEEKTSDFRNNSVVPPTSHDQKCHKELFQSEDVKTNYSQGRSSSQQNSIIRSSNQRSHSSNILIDSDENFIQDRQYDIPLPQYPGSSLSTEFDASSLHALNCSPLCQQDLNTQYRSRTQSSSSSEVNLFSSEGERPSKEEIPYSVEANTPQRKCKRPGSRTDLTDEQGPPKEEAVHSNVGHQTAPLLEDARSEDSQILYKLKPTSSFQEKHHSNLFWYQKSSGRTEKTRKTEDYQEISRKATELWIYKDDNYAVALGQTKKRKSLHEENESQKKKAKR